MTLTPEQTQWLTYAAIAVGGYLVRHLKFLSFLNLPWEQEILKEAEAEVLKLTAPSAPVVVAPAIPGAAPIAAPVHPTDHPLFGKLFDFVMGLAGKAASPAPVIVAVDQSPAPATPVVAPAK
jgi:hypothetical protein